jgi:glycerol-3-phosphate dehydrogenase
MSGDDRSPTDNDFDLVVIGGGTNGCAVFLTAVLSGLKVLLLERNKIGMGTNYSSLGLVQGGLQYVKRDLDLVQMDCIDAGLLKAIAPHMVREQKIIVPVFDHNPFPLNRMGLWEVYMRAYDGYAGFKRCQYHKGLTSHELRKLEPLLHANSKGGIMYEEYVADPVQLANALVYAGTLFGGTVKEHAEVIDLRAGGQHPHIRGLVYSQRGAVKYVRARYFVNTTGAWTTRLMKKLSLKNSALKLRPTKGTSIVIKRRFCHDAVILFNRKGKYTTLLPQGRNTLVGPTNHDVPDKVKDNPDLLTFDKAEVLELLDTINRHFELKKPVSASDIVVVKCGLRPQLYDDCKKPENVTHRFIIYDHSVDGLHNFTTLIGGKLSNQIRMAKELVKSVCDKLEKRFVWEVPFLTFDASGNPTVGATPRYPVTLYRKSFALTDESNVGRVVLRSKLKALLNLAKHGYRYRRRGQG